MSHGFLRHESDDGTSFFVEQNASAVDPWLTDGPYAVENDLVSLFVFGNYSVDGTVERDGRTLVELTAESAASNEDTAPAYESRVLVTSEGVVYEAESSFSREVGDGREYRNVSLSLDTDAEWTMPPSWVGDLSHLSASVVEDGRALELRNTGGATLPANATFTASAADSSRETPADLDESSADANASSFTLRDESARGEYAFVAAKLTGESENTTYTLVAELGED
ncbi:hypothetical protein [Halobacterium hubeiense]|uniref:hypothetical protein n=1 Tax=Halobacterium hubeiense TaxID=1407499 RepID=UPI000B7D48CD|nr:hypothetical protein [Halobacterium hubeiense]